MSIVAPPTSLIPPALNALLTPTDWIISVSKKSRDILIFRIFSEGTATVKGSRIIAVAQSTDEKYSSPHPVWDSATFGYSPSIGKHLCVKLLTLTACTAMTAFCCSSTTYSHFHDSFCYHHNVRKFVHLSPTPDFRIASFPFSTRTLTYFRFISYIFNLYIIQTFQNTGTVQFKITVHIGHGSAGVPTNCIVVQSKVLWKFIFHSTLILILAANAGRTHNKTKKKAATENLKEIVFSSNFALRFITSAKGRPKRLQYEYESDTMVWNSRFRFVTSCYKLIINDFTTLFQPLTNEV